MFYSNNKSNHHEVNTMSWNPSCGRRGLKEGILSNRFGPTKQLGLIIHYLKSSTIKVIHIVKPRQSTRLRNLKSIHSSGNCRRTTKVVWLETGEGSRDMQVTQGGSFQIKHPSPPHLIHYTNSVNCINGRMTPEQCPHTLHPTLPPPVK